MLAGLIEEDGFAVIPEVFAASEMESLLTELDRVPLLHGRAGLRHALRHPAIEYLAKDSRLLRIARDVIGGQAFPFQATLFHKSTSSNWLVVWHQDTALPLDERREVPGWGPWSVKDGVIYAHAPTSALCHVLALRVHLDDSTDENGPLRVLRKSHKDGVLSDEAIHELASRLPAVGCTIPKGGILAMRPLLVHSSSKSHADTPRRVIHIEYSASPIIGDGFKLAVA